MLQSLLNFLREVILTILQVCEYIYSRVSLLNPGTLIGFGVAGGIGLIVFLTRPWFGVFYTVVVPAVFGACICGGIYKSDRWNSNERVIPIADLLQVPEKPRAITQQ